MTAQHRCYYENKFVRVGTRNRVRPLLYGPVHSVQLIYARSLSLTFTRIGELFDIHEHDY
ncbi:uncharacterized protein Smp_203550 [Schistosoma mansoni]|uniref:uncharacterized protein n=1 Tax=Schistosoma mansoni TaxID=6183 RepID=UPI00022DCAB0|nr:uncharacterized protein Smp_203550 [Schistosoma mansoni]|eukprot:XP_018654544.1 uncharacterized protein Smp_203550 [Schistosoma mansoni]